MASKVCIWALNKARFSLYKSKGTAMHDLFSLKGRTALVTGGTKGIGRMIATAYLEFGAKVIINARNAEQCAATVDELSSLGDISASPGDISTLDGIDEVTSGIADDIDILVNNAGTTSHEPFLEFSEQGWDNVLDLNLKAAFFLTQKLGPALIANGTAERPAKVINISSINAIYNSRNPTPSYIASKAGIIQLTKHQAQKFVRKNVVVTCIAPGSFPSDMNRGARDNPEVASRGIPSGRVGSIEDIGGTAVFLASRAGDYIVGETIIVDGGITHTMGPG